MKILFIGGTGVISSACTVLAKKRGFDITLLNRGQTEREIPEDIRVIHGDIRDTQSIEKLLNNFNFDVVVNWIAYTPDHVESDIRLFQNRIKQYIFISSAAAYQKPPASLPITESTPLYNPFWEYARQKIACEDRLIRVYRETHFPMTIVRPSHTYDRTMLPFKRKALVLDQWRLVQLHQSQQKMY